MYGSHTATKWAVTDYIFKCFYPNTVNAVNFTCSIILQILYFLTFFGCNINLQISEIDHKIENIYYSCVIQIFLENFQPGNK